jgi:serine/threonine protein kinase
MPQQQTNTPASTDLKSNVQASGTRPLLPGVLLRGGRYRLQELIERQDWLSGVFEGTWIGKDAHRGGSQVMICEVVLPENTSVMTQSILRTATMTLASVGRHPHIPTLWDAFSDQGRSFFVFEPIEGESLLSRMRHSGHTMAEGEVIECCLQMTEVLELLAQQTPPLVHGLIRPEHIIMGRNASQFVLTNFSVILAGGATQFVSGMDRSRLSSYTAPEFIRGVIDVRTDMYSLIASAYYAVTASVPGVSNGNVPSAQRLNNKVSAEFDAILTKGLRAVASQRYQRPSELRQDLLAMRSVSGTLVSSSNRDGAGSRIAANAFPPADFRNGQHIQPAAQRVPDRVAEALPIMLTPTVEEEEEQSLLPRPEDLPPMKESNDMFNATFWLGLIVAALIFIAVLSQVSH